MVGKSNTLASDLTRWFPLVPNWRISVFEKRLNESEKSYNLKKSVKKA